MFKMFEQFVSCVQQYVKKVHLLVAEDRNKDLEQNIKAAIPVLGNSEVFINFQIINNLIFTMILFVCFLTGAMSVHQICWNMTEKNISRFNKLTCLECKSRCNHGFFLCEKVYPIDKTVPNTSKLETESKKKGM